MLTFDMVLLLCGLFFVAAALYSTVGHAGASAYLAAMALVGVAPAHMRPTALVLNVIVASLASYRYWRAGYFSWAVLRAFLIGSVPFAFIGGGLQLPGEIYRPILGVILWLGALRLLLPGGFSVPNRPAQPPHPVVSALTGGAIGLLSGLTGTGGGIFLSPLLILAGWCEVRTASGVVAAFILANSLAGLAGNIGTTGIIGGEIFFFAVAVMAGGLVGTWLGIAGLAPRGVLRALGLVMVVAGAKLIFA